jgi:hypothetical protein
MAARLMGYVSASNTPTVVEQSAYGRATGGIGSPTAVNISGVDYEYLTFNATGTLTVTTAGWFDYLAIGGGTGSFANNNLTRSGSGGGAGQVKVGSIYLDANQTITIGAGAGFTNVSVGLTQAIDTQIAATAPFAVIASGGYATMDTNGKSLGFVGGGCGSILSETSINITGSTAIGFKGGNGPGNATAGAGGGGSTAAGANGSGTTGGAGGAGTDISSFIGGSASFRATGGGGGASVTPGAGGNSSASSNAGTTNTTPNSAAANSGSGGGGGHGTPYTTGNGGSAA